MSLPRLLAAAVFVLLLAPLPGCAQDGGTGGDGAAATAGVAVSPLIALQTGDYAAAISGYRDDVLAGRHLPESARGWARALTATGRYADALEALDRSIGAGAAPAELGRIRGDVLRDLGRGEAAESSYRLAIAAPASDAQIARLGLGRLLWSRGERPAAEDEFDSFIDFYNASRNLGAEDLAAVGAALASLGTQRPALFHDAVRAYEEAIRVDLGDPEPKVALARLFLDKFDSRNAGVLLGEALERNPRHAPGLLAAAGRARFDGSPEAIDLAGRSLEVNPQFTAAHTLLAELYLELEEYERAEAAARLALEINPASPEAWTALAAVAHLRGDEGAFEDARDQVLAVDPRHAGLFVTLAEAAYRTRRYGDAVEFARRAVALDDHSWAGHASLGMNLLRTGNFAGGRASLETAFAGDPFNLWVKNTLDLLDELDGFDSAESPRFRFLLHPDESGVLSIYATALAEEAFEAMSERYAYAPPTPISVEIYDRHADFSVRTIGLAGLGALGVSFGSVLAMDSPGARPTGEFNWGSTLWHETSHAFTLGYTEHRIPRWFSEGLAVLDERRAREGWGSDVDPGFLEAFRDGRLPTLQRFGQGFVRPAYPGQVQHSYLLASLLSELIEERHGLRAIRAMLDGYRDGGTTAQVFRTALGSSVGDVQEELDDYIAARFASAIAALGPPADEGAPPTPGPFVALLVAGRDLQAEGRSDEAIAALERARTMFPEYVGPGSPLLGLGRLYAARGDDARAVEAYREYTNRNEDDLEAHLEFAELQRRLGDADGERATLARTLWIEPFALDPHRRLAEAHERAGDWPSAVRERRALLALGPTDRAAALYHLARAQHGTGDAAAAHRSVLQALEIAPGYEDALELLLTIREGG